MGLKALGGYFDNLAAASTNEKTVLEKLVASNAKLAAKKKELVAVVKKLTNHNKDLQRATASRKGAAVRRNRGRGTQQCAPIARTRAILILKPV